jgi:hypothetical protein
VPDTDTPPTVKDAYRAIISFEAHRDIFSNSRFISKITGHGLIWDAKASFVLAARGELTMVDEIVMTVAGTTDVKARVDFLQKPICEDAWERRRCCSSPEKPWLLHLFNLLRYWVKVSKRLKAIEIG